jgi:hypothetical protein
LRCKTSYAKFSQVSHHKQSYSREIGIIQGETVVKKLSNKENKKAFQKKSRRKYDCPPQLEAFLIKMNWIEPKKRLEEFSDVLVLSQQENANLNELEITRAALKRCLEDLPVEFQNFVKYGVPKLPEDFLEILALSTGDILTDISNQVFRYEDFRLSSLKLSRLVMLREKHNAAYAARAISEDFNSKVLLQVDENGIIQVTSDSFGEAINGVNFDRIRSCKICERVFWATNVNSKACSPKHASNLRLQKSRQLNKEKRQENRDLENEKRRDNYAYKKKLKKGK